MRVMWLVGLVINKKKLEKIEIKITILIINLSKIIIIEKKGRYIPS